VKLLNMGKILTALIWSDEAVKSVSRRSGAGWFQTERPDRQLIFSGPTAVGRGTHQYWRLFFGSEDAMIRLDMSNTWRPGQQADASRSGLFRFTKVASSRSGSPSPTTLCS